MPDEFSPDQVEVAALGNLLVVVPSMGAQNTANALFQNGIRLAKLTKSQTPSKTLDSEFARVACFPRRNGTGTPVLVDPESGNWVVAVGTWFHDSGFASGQEDRLLDRFSDVGADRLAGELEGFFVVVTGDAMTRTVTVITDIVGTLHCYVRSLDGAMVISTSSRLLAGLADTSLDPIACQEFLQSGAMYEDRTFYNEVRKLEAANCFHYKNGTLESRRPYWQLTDLAADSLDGDQSVEAMRESVLTAARRLSMAFPNPVVDLTGGYDSRVTVAAFLKAGVKFCAAVSGAPMSADVVIAKGLAAMTGLDLLYSRPDPATTFDQLQDALQLTDGEFNLVEYASIYEIHAAQSKNFSGSINGYSGEIGRGYGWELLIPDTGKRAPLNVAKIATRRFACSTFDASLFPAEIRFDPASHYRDVMERTNEGLGSLPNTLQYDYCMTMLRCQRWYGRIASSTNQIWPCLSFFLLRSIIKPMLETNTRSRNRSLLTRRLLADIQPALANYPLELGYPPLPATWTNFYRFWPMIPLYGGKVISKLRERFLPKRTSSSESRGGPQIALWKDPKIQEILNPGNLQSTRVLDAAAVGQFLERSKSKDFSSYEQWALLLSLECTLQSLKSIRSELGSREP